MDQNEWAKSVLCMTEHKLLEVLEDKNKDDAEDWTSSDVETVKNAAKALSYIQCVKKEVK